MDEPAFSLAEIILGTFFALIIDIIAAVASLFSFGLLGILVHSGTWLIFTLWFTIKGVKVTASLVRRYILPIAVQAIPFLPTTTATFLVTTYMENHPEKFGVIAKVASAAEGTASKL
jgi:xanthosine utilization system XapX-like protein